MELKVKYLTDIKPLEKFREGDWIDLRAAKDMNLKVGEYAVIPLGICVELPKGYEAHIAPRSSTFKQWNIIQVNGVGIVDETYCGDNDEWGMPVYAVQDTVIHKNDRVCQFRLVYHQPEFTITKVPMLGNPDRKGFGHSGR